MKTPHRTSSLPIWLIVTAAVAAAIGLWLGQRLFSAAQPPRLDNAVLYPAPRTIPEFHLTRADGRPLTLADWRGRWTVVYFGYTSCPDVCPTTLATFKQAWKDLAARKLAGRIRFDFISVDPQRDTPEVLHKYVSYFDPDFVAATGPDSELTPLTRAMGLMYSRSTDANGTISVEHSGAAVIVDPQAREAGILRPPFAAKAIASDLVTLAASR
ncbi:MAG: SCO family protein [Xanthomonadaceae bacterium]|nr:SCO family protein [Xanthomonadaceae bacterium]